MADDGHRAVRPACRSIRLPSVRHQVIERLAEVAAVGKHRNPTVLSSIGPGGVFAEAYACVPGEPLMVNVTAAEDTRALLLNIRRVLEPCANVCPRHVRLVRNLLTLCSEKNLQLSRRVLHTGPKSIRKRLLSYFSECIKRTGSYSFDIPFNRQQLADYLSVERSALSNELSLMQRDGLIRYEKNHFDVVEQIDG